MACDTWHVMHGERWTFSQNFSSPTLWVWDGQGLWDSEQKDHVMNESMNQWINNKGVYRTAQVHRDCLKGVWNLLKAMFLWNLSSICSFVKCPNFISLFTSQPAEGVIGNIVIPSSRNSGLLLNPAFRKDEFTRSPAVEKWRQGCCVEGIADFSNPGARALLPLIGPQITWSVPGLWLVNPPSLSPSPPPLPPPPPPPTKKKKKKKIKKKKKK